MTLHTDGENSRWCNSWFSLVETWGRVHFSAYSNMFVSVCVRVHARGQVSSSELAAIRAEWPWVQTNSGGVETNASSSVLQINSRVI